jgi:hypothetical protein
MFRRLSLVFIIPVCFILGLTAQTCTIAVEAPASIQAAVNGAAAGDVICLKGVFSESVTLNKSYLTIRSAPGETAVLDGTALGINHDAFTLSEGVSNITIEGLEIRNYGRGSACCGWGNAVQAWDVNTSYITIRNNYMHGNNWNGILAGSEGGTMHTGWAVHGNRAEDNGFAQIELTNCSGCSIHRNTVVGNTTWVTDDFPVPTAIGILVQARNMGGSASPVLAQGVSVQGNNISGCGVGGGLAWYDICVYVLAAAYDPGSAPTPASLKAVSVVQNTITGLRGVVVRGYTVNDYGIVPGGTAGLAINTAVVGNTISCSGGSDAYRSIGVRVMSNSINTKVVNNAITSCMTNIENAGEDTRIPPSRSKK